FDINKKFLIHSLDTRNFQNHISEILKLAGEEAPEKVIITADPSRADIQSYQQVINRLFGSKTEVEIENL
ncbi:MAG TPA: hypothetical protein PK886_00790, partial [Candidatus Paceibacterota bacterium]|nr:hypothetical protein [Candidatus Paceibacterota bacterium]